MARDLKYSYIGPYLRDWLEYAREKCEAEEQVIKDGNEFRVPYSAVQTEVVQLIFALSERYNLEHQAKYMAVHLLDRCTGFFFWELVTDLPQINDTTMRQVYDTMSGQIKLLLVTCLQIASKVDLYKNGLDLRQVDSLLKCIDSSREYSKSNILNCEKKILWALDWRLPICLPIDAVELFLVYAELSSKDEVRDTCLHLLDVAYLRHEELFEQMHLLATRRPYNKSISENRNFLGLETNSVFLGAAVVVCSNFFFHLKRSIVDSLAARLGNLIEFSEIDITALANILFSFAIDEDDLKNLQTAVQSRNGSQVY